MPTQEHPRFSSMDQESKQQYRKKERDAKKDRERTLAFFTAAKRTLEDPSSLSDASMASTVVEGLLSELSKKLRDDPELFLLRNGTVCRALELAVTMNTSLLHAKTFLYLFIGKFRQVATSPTVSYVLEALLSNMMKCLGELSMGDDNNDVSQETLPDGDGVHSGSGLPNSFVLLRHMVEELVEAMDALLVDAIGSKMLRSVVYVLCGVPIRKQQEQPVPCVALLRQCFLPLASQLAEALVNSVETVFAPENIDKPRRSDAWFTACVTPASSMVIQAFLRVSHPDNTPSIDIRQRLEKFQLINRPSGDKVPLLAKLMRDPLGSHVFQAYLRCAPSNAVIAAAEELYFKEHNAGEQFVQRILKMSGSAPQESTSQLSIAELVEKHNDTLFCSPWDYAFSLLMKVLDSELLSENSEEVRLTSFLLQDFASFAPTAYHLRLFWEELLKPRLQLTFDLPALSAVLLRFTRKCAFTSSSSKKAAGLTKRKKANPNSSVHDDDGLEAMGSTASVKEVDDLIKRDEDLGALYFPTTIAFRKEVLETLLQALKQFSPKGAPQALLVDLRLGETCGFELCTNLLHFGATAASSLINSFDKLCLESLVEVSRHPQGTFVMQAWIRLAAAKDSLPPQRKPEVQTKPTTAVKAAPALPGSVAKHPPPPSKSSAAVATMPISFPLVRRMTRRLMPHLESMAQHKYAAFVVESLYEASPTDLKEEIVKLLIPLHQRIKHQTLPAAESNRKRPRDESDTVEATTEADANATAEESSPPAGDVSDFFALKVLTKCCVEQYLHRPDEWRSGVQRAEHVQKLMQRILSLDEVL